MTQQPDLTKQKPDKTEEPELPQPWNRIQGAVWLIGLAILAWKGWWWPGILVLAAVSGLVQAGIQLYLSSQNKVQQNLSEEKDLAKERGEWLPSICPACGAPLKGG